MRQAMGMFACNFVPYRTHLNPCQICVRFLEIAGRLIAQAGLLKLERLTYNPPFKEFADRSHVYADRSEGTHSRKHTC
jgi:hypothetical protein